jgi:hypothetical protein
MVRDSQPQTISLILQGQRGTNDFLVPNPGLGLGQVIIVQVARAFHDAAGQRVASPCVASPRVAGLVRFSAKWFAAAGCVGGAAIAIAGTWLLSMRAALPQSEWLPAWLATCGLVAVDIAFSGLMFPLEGAGLVRPVYFCRMIRSILNSAVLWLCIFIGLRLWCLPAALAASLLWTAVFLLSKDGTLVRTALSPDSPVERVAWRKEMLSSQWRIALSSLAEFASFYTLTPFAYVAYGPVLAGQIGVTWQIAASVSAIAGAVVSTKFPELSRLVAARSVDQLDRLMIVTTAASLIVCGLGVLAVGGGVLWLNHEGFQLASRLLPVPDVAVMLAGVLIWHVNLSIVAYLRAHGGDPFLPVTLGGAILMLLSEFTFGRWFGPSGMLWSYALIGACFMIPAGISKFLHKRREFGYPGFSLAPR